ncbi:methyltransferase [Desulfopila sp. IMCC35008]|uniref:class I SAM-dependent methyltransferase n=1 Tax=Desulfopila sp. IMCC35008 TaxID=2653858 RepID=UPI0013D2CD7E|nr:methyltransferase domain-containing protein [Desulfopila sp. IMCC35008]
MSHIRIRYSTIEFRKFDIHVRTLRDKQQFSDPEGEASKLGISSATWPFFGIIWESGIHLANLMEDHPVGGKSILEIGCGIGLASLVLNHRGANITATDYHPEVKVFLDENTHLNKDPDISFVRTSWDDHLPNTLGLFDFIIGSDLLYEQEHPGILASFINRHAKKKSTALIVAPQRGYSCRFMKHMTEFGFNHSVNQHKLFTGKTLCFTR